MSAPVTTRDLFEALRNRLALRWAAGAGGGDRHLRSADDTTGRENIAGPLNYIHPNRIQVIGNAELAYLHEMPDEARRNAVQRLFQARPAAVILTDDIQPDAALVETAESSDTPLLLTPVSDTQLLAHLQYHLSIVLADRITIHGVFLEVLGMGVLITGDAAAGKSELALELLTRGNRLVADDAPEFSRIAPDIVSGTCPPMLQDYLEVRGLGILNIRAMFGDSAIKHSKYLRLMVRLKRMDAQTLAGMDRLTGSHATQSVLGVEIPEVTVPVAPGRNLAILVETAVRSHLLRLQGYDAAEDFINRQREAIERNRMGG